VLFVYFSTYVAANASESICNYYKVHSLLPKFLATSAVNVPTGILKDRAFARMFGCFAPKPFPLISVAIFSLRDSLTMFASFTMPRLIGDALSERGTMSYQQGLNLAQLSCPVLIQFISCPLHLLGFDIYNRKGETRVSRVAFIKREYFKTAFARISRIGFAYSVGGVGNLYIKSALFKRFLFA